MEHQNNHGDDGVEFFKEFLREAELNGLQSLIPWSKVSEIVERIYHKRGLYIAKAESVPTQLTSSNKQLGKCPYCQSEIHNERDIIYCAICSIPYHIECWDENGCCAVVGCGSKEKMDSSYHVPLNQGSIDISSTDLPDYENDISNGSDYTGVILIGAFIFIIILAIIASASP